MYHGVSLIATATAVAFLTTIITSSSQTLYYLLFFSFLPQQPSEVPGRRVQWSLTRVFVWWSVATRFGNVETPLSIPTPEVASYQQVSSENENSTVSKHQKNQKRKQLKQDGKKKTPPFKYRIRLTYSRSFCSMSCISCVHSLILSIQSREGNSDDAEFC